MTDRGAATSDRAPACPFVAFDDDRDERADRPDRRHRCYAEIRPAPRAIAHQESYCLSPRFPTCPTFQDWARREAAQSRNAGGRGAPEASPVRPAAEGDVAAPELDDGPVDTEGAADERPNDPPDLDEPTDDLPPRGRTHRDWAAPPPWVNPAAGAEPGSGDPHGAGLATSRWLADVRPGDDAGDDEEALAQEGSAPRARAVGAAGTPGPGDPEFVGLAEATPRPELAGIVGRPRRPVRPTQDRGRRERPVVGQARPAGRPERGRDRDDPTPSWERPRRFEAYPSLRGRVSMPSVPRVALGAAALLVAAVLLFTLPAMFLTKSGPSAVGSPTPSPVPSVSVAPTASPAPTALTYTVKPGDTLIKIANHFKVTQHALLAANPSLKNANVITIGQVLVIPTPPPPDVVKSSAGPSASPSGSTVP